MSIYKYKNITFHLTIADVAFDIGLANRNEFIGMTLLDISSNSIKKMKKKGYYREEQHNQKTYFIPPHTDIYDYIDDDTGKVIGVNRDLDYSYNTDLHIVYFKWMLECTRTNFVIEIACDNPYWIFHDISHINDVYGSEVCCLSGSLEQIRLNEGLELMIEAGYTPKFSQDYINIMKDSFYDRWKVDLDITEFIPYIEDDEDNYE